MLSAGKVQSQGRLRGVRFSQKTHADTVSGVTYPSLLSDSQITSFFVCDCLGLDHFHFKITAYSCTIDVTSRT